MAFTHLETQKQIATSGTTVVVTKPAGTVDGNLLVARAHLECGAGTNPTISASGWTIVQAIASTATYQVVLYKRASGEGASTTFTASHTIVEAGVSVSAFASSGLPVLDDSSQVIGAADVNACANSVTTTRAGDLLVFGVANASNATYTAPSGFTEPVNGEVDSGSRVGEVAYKLDAGAAGATGSVCATQSASLAYRAFLAAFKEIPRVTRVTWVGM